jgi:hypothetical protein
MTFFRTAYIQFPKGRRISLRIGTQLALRAPVVLREPDRGGGRSR